MNVSLSSLDLKYLIRKTVTDPGGVDVRQFYQSGLSGPAAWANTYFYLFLSGDVSNLFASPRRGGLVRKGSGIPANKSKIFLAKSAGRCVCLACRKILITPSLEGADSNPILAAAQPSENAPPSSGRYLRPTRKALEP